MLRSIAAWTIVTYLLAAATFELVHAVRHELTPTGEGFVLLGALIAMLTGAAIVATRVRAAPLIAPAAALFLTARFYTGDTYYGSTFRSYADGGVFPPAWVFVLLGLAVLAGLTTYLWRRTATPFESVIVLLLLAFTALFMGTGH